MVCRVWCVCNLNVLCVLIWWQWPPRVAFQAANPCDIEKSVVAYVTVVMSARGFRCVILTLCLRHTIFSVSFDR